MFPRHNTTGLNHIQRNTFRIMPRKPRTCLFPRKVEAQRNQTKANQIKQNTSLHQIFKTRVRCGRQTFNSSKWIFELRPPRST